MTFKFLQPSKKEAKRVIILGSTGIISKNLQKKLKKKSIIFFSIGRSNLNLKKHNANKILGKKFKNGDVVVFIAAETPCKNITMFFNNITICQTVCDSLKNKNISQLIYISSDAVYSDIKGKISETYKTMPVSLHGLMHLFREKILIEKFNKVLCILRPTLIYGPDDTHLGYGPNKFIQLALKNENIKIFGNGEEKRDHLYINDLTNIIFKCITKRSTGILNVASGEVYSFRYLAEQIIKIINSKSKIVRLKRMGAMPHNGYRPFNIKLIHKNFKDIKKNQLNLNLENYINLFSNNEN